MIAASPAVAAPAPDGRCGRGRGARRAAHVRGDRGVAGALLEADQLLDAQVAVGRGGERRRGRGRREPRGFARRRFLACAHARALRVSDDEPTDRMCRRICVGPGIAESNGHRNVHDRARSARELTPCNDVQLPVMPPVAPMLAKPAAAIPPGQFYEPKWDGFRSIVFRDGDEVEIGSRKERPMTRYFPEVVEAVKRAFPARAVIDGEIVIAGDDRPRLLGAPAAHPPGEEPRRPARRETPASFVAFDLLALGDEDLTATPFHERRRRARAGARSTPRRRSTSPRSPRTSTTAAGLVRALRRRRPRRPDRQAPRPHLPTRQARDDEDQARAHGGLRRRRLPRPQGARGRDRLAPARPATSTTPPRARTGPTTGRASRRSA